MPVASWDAPESEATALSTDLNSLANNTLSALSAAIDNEADQYQYIVFEIALASLNPTGTPYVEVWIFYSLDGTNYEDGAATSLDALKATIPVSTGSGAKRRVSAPVLLLPLKCKLAVRNVTAVSFAASGNTLKYSRFNEEAD